MPELNPEVVTVLRRLLDDTDDLADVPEDSVIELLQALRQRRKIEGRAAALLHQRGWSWPRIAATLSLDRRVDQSTVQKWARDYRMDGDSS